MSLFKRLKSPFKNEWELHFKVSDQVFVRLSALRRDSGMVTLPELFKQMTRLYEQAMACHKRGGHIILEEHDGTQHRVEVTSDDED